MPESVQVEEGDEVFRAAVIRPGVYTPGGGPFHGERVAVTEDFIRAAAPSLEGKPVNLEHGFEVNDEVGFHRNVAVEDDEGLVLRADLVLQEGRPRFEDAVSFIEGRLEADQVPEYSMELPHESLVWQHADEGELFQGEPFDVKLLGGEFSGGAILTEGACSAEDGCGIGLRADSEVHRFCPDCGDEVAVPVDAMNRSTTDDQTRDSTLNTRLSGTTRTTEKTMTDEDEDGSGGDKVAAQLAEEKDKLTAELEDARSRLESKDEKLEQLEAQVAAKEAEEREALLAEIREAATEDFVEEHVDEDMGLPEIKALHTGLNAGPVEDDGDSEQEAGAERQTQAERGKGRQTVTSPTGEQVDLRAYNALREVYGLSPVEDGSDLHPDLHSAFHRAKQNRRGQARIVLPPNNGGGN